MALSASSGLVDTGALTGTLQNLHTAEEREGALTSVLISSVGASAAAKYARLMIEASFDSSASNCQHQARFEQVIHQNV